MSNTAGDSRSLLKRGESDVSELSVSHRHSYHRMDSSQDLNDPAPSLPSPVPSTTATFEGDSAAGLGISNKRTSIQRVPVGSRIASMSSPRAVSSPFSTAQNSPLIIEPSKPLLGSPRNIYEGAMGRQAYGSEEEQDVTKGRDSVFHEDFAGEDDRRRMVDNDTLNDNEHRGACPPAHDFHSKRSSWVSISILGLSLFSTIFSGLYIFVPIWQPRYGHIISSKGNLTLSTASTLFALFAKTIEISFVTVFITFLAMLIALLYTTASDALVSPHLKFGKLEHKMIYGLAQASYGNPTFITANCATPVTRMMDPTYGGNACISIDYAGQAYHNSIAYMSTWSVISAGNGTSSNLAERPQAPGMLYDNTTVTGSWILRDTSDVTVAHQKYNRVINNISLAMPHAGVLAAALNPRNAILQPDDLAGLGQYSLQASVVSPVVNVLCINMNKTELAPLVYVTWPNATTTNVSTVPGQKMAWPGYEGDSQVLPGKQYANSTVVDDLFWWGEKYGRQPPIFPMYPIDYNTLTNITSPYSDSVYLLVKSPNTTDYTMCQMRSFVTPSCSTHYNVSGTAGGHLEALCEDPTDKMAYSKSTTDAPTVKSTDWRNVAAGWMLAVSLNTGITNSNASTSRQLSQFVIPTPVSGDVKLNATLPSLSEYLAVMVGSTLLSSTTLSTYYHYWNWTEPDLPDPVYLPFNASLTSQQYASGPTQRWEGIFYVPLLLVFVTNVFCLVYLFLRPGLVTDYTEPQNLFALAINSPPSQALDGSCGAGPRGNQLNADWHVKQDQTSGHVYMADGGSTSATPVLPQDYELRRRQATNDRSFTSYSKLSSSRSSWL
ncbi:hypothetical protein LSUE1_G006034 [Lachnellula suecica]|uniref:Uncharacterized protein n=1 Tax=Lachnellula suecica TaxID=602035 RepID=A0A8T9C2I1_9HELO|nr:hypothetical protein LSUE1_G006034 [Lachnellula suecica]